jgi:hypothetical protein
MPRNTHYDDMNPYCIPEDIEKLIKQPRLFPYSLLREEFIDKHERERINGLLDGVLVKGCFKAWPLNYQYPIIELEEDIAEFNFRNMRDCIIYESGVRIQRFTDN